MRTRLPVCKQRAETHERSLERSLGGGDEGRLLHTVTFPQSPSLARGFASRPRPHPSAWLDAGGHCRFRLPSFLRSLFWLR